MKYLHFLLLAVCLVSCEKPLILDEDSTVNDSEANLIVTVYQMETIPFTKSMSRAALADHCTRLNFAVYDSLNTRVKQINQLSSDQGFGTAYFKLDPGKYRVVVVAHSSDGNPTMTNPAKIQFKNNQGYTDTFMSNDTIELGESSVTLPVDLNRIVSLCRFVITDPVPDNISQMRFQYTGGSGAFDASTGLGSVKSTQTVWINDINPGQESSVFDLYTFLHAEEGTIHLLATAYDENSNVQNEREFDIPMKRRKVTKLTGAYFSDSPSGSSSTITVIINFNDDWEGEDVISY